MGHSYDQTFMQYTDTSSRRSAERIVDLLAKHIPVGSVLDVGCAKGTWLAAWQARTGAEIQGVDGDYLQRSELLIAPEHFQSADLARPLALDRQFDLVQSLEVAEHIAASAADQFVENLVRHSRGIVLFSAAPPGQGGEYHINEQDYEYWRGKFAKQGYVAYDFVRPLIATDTSVSFWYRYNVFLYVRRDMANTLPEAIAGTRVPDDRPLADISPALFRLRKMVVRLLPSTLREGLARFKANYLPSGRW